jgi:DNA-binding NtrC family response regulator
LLPLDQEVQAGRFRADLYYRIQGVTLEIPPLRERPADIAPLVQHFLAELSARHNVRPPRLLRATLSALRSYDWPGNVRELRNVIELLCLLRPGKPARVADLPPALRKHAARAHAHRPKIDAVPMRGSPEEDGIRVRLDQSLAAILTQVMHAALEMEGGNRSRAARRLNISLRTVQRHLARVGPRAQRTSRRSKNVTSR